MEDKMVNSLLLLGADIASDVLIDYYYTKKSEGVISVTIEEILADAKEYRTLRKTEIAKVRARMSEGE